MLVIYEACADSQKNVVKCGKTKAGRQRYMCRTCGHTFTETNLLSSSHACGRDHPCWPKGISLSRVKGHKEDTILAWLRDAAEHAAALEAELLARYWIERGQLDSLWAYVGNKGEKKYPETAESGQFWRTTLIDMDTRLRVARGIAKTETEASQQVFETLKKRGHPDAPPPLVSDGWGGVDEAIIAVYGAVPAYTGIGRPPTRKRPQPGWQYLQVVKQRQNGRVVGTTLRVV